jgi:hypothetical protein
MSWEQLYNLLRIRDFIYFVSAPELQDALFPAKLVFVAFAMFFLAYVIYFMINSSWLQYKFLEDTTEFFSWQAFGVREMEKQWARIKKRAESGTDSDYKLAVIDADDFLLEVLENRGYEGKDFQESVEKASKLLGPLAKEVLSAHQIRDSIVYNPDQKISTDEYKKMLDTYEVAAKTIGM